ncbi:unnamed protein product, partial [Closterium sp. NIES-54]
MCRPHALCAAHAVCASHGLIAACDLHAHPRLSHALLLKCFARLHLPPGIVLFPEQTLPLRVQQARFRAAVTRAMGATGQAAHLLGVVRSGAAHGGAAHGGAAHACDLHAHPRLSHALLLKCFARLHLPPGIVLFPEQTLPLRVQQARFRAAVTRAMGATGQAAHLLGVVHVHMDPHGFDIRVASVGTTAEIRRVRQQEDGSMSVVTRGRQRFLVRRAWMDPDGSPAAEVQILEDATPLRLPAGAFSRCRGMRAAPSSCMRDAVGGRGREGARVAEQGAEGGEQGRAMVMADRGEQHGHSTGAAAGDDGRGGRGERIRGG